MFLLFLSILFILLISFWGYGSSLKKDYPFLYQIFIGYTCYLGFYQLIGSLLVYFNTGRLSTIILNLLILIIGVLLFLKNIRPFKFINTNKIIYLALFIGFICFLFYNTTIGVETFDTLHYLSIINERQTNDILGYTYYDSGIPFSKLQIHYDFTMYYTFWGNILNIITIINSILFNHTSINIHFFLWGSVIVYSILTYSFFDNFIQNFKITNKQLILILVSFVLFFYPTNYFVSAFSFYGNTYRTLLIGLLVYEFYISNSNKLYNKKDALLLMLITSCAIAHSSSSFFICTVVIGINIKLYLSNKELTKSIDYIVILSIPLFQFAYYYVGFKFIYIIIIFICLYILHKIFIGEFLNDIMVKYLNYLYYLIPISLILLNLIINKSFNLIDYFDNYSYYDMMLFYFNVTSIKPFIINSIIWISIFVYLFKSENLYFKKYIIYFFLIYNPFTYQIIIQILTGPVHYRLYDSVFNIFTFMIIISFMYKFIANRCLIKKFNLSILILFICIYYGTSQIVTKYNPYFEPNVSYNKIKKINSNAEPVLQYLIDNINYNQTEKPRILSQFLPIKAFVPNIISYPNYSIVRKTNVYGINNNDSELYRVFYPRLNAEMINFEQETDYTKACELIQENDFDYILIDKSQNFIKDNNFVYIDELVYSCQGVNVLYTDDHFTLYSKD